MLIALNLFLVIFFVFLNAFFVLAEFALVKVRKSRIDLLTKKGNTSAKFTQKIIKNLNNYLSACQLGITLSSLALGWIGEPAVADMLHPIFKSLNLSAEVSHLISFIIAFTIITGLHIVFGELIPKSLAIINAEKFSLLSAMPLALFYNLTFPVMLIFNKTTNFILKLFGYSIQDEHDIAHTDEEIKLLVEESYKHGLIDKYEFTYVDNIFEFSDKSVKEIMIPRRDISCISKNDSIEDILKITMKDKFSRYPVYENDKDNIIGYFHTKDLYEKKISNTLLSIDSILRKILVFPQSTQIPIILKKFQHSKENIALIVDEYGGTSGLISIEDILEEIVGNIQDEYDEDENDITTVNASTYLVKGFITIEKLNSVGIKIDCFKYYTLAGFLMDKIDNILNEKTPFKFDFGQYTFIIESISERRITDVKIIINNKDESN